MVQHAANGLLDGTGRRIDDARRKGWIDTIQQAQMERVLIDIANAQGGMERLKNTPLPNQYRFFPTFFTHLFCILLPIGLVESLGFATPLGSTIAGLMFLAVLQIQLNGTTANKARASNRVANSQARPVQMLRQLLLSPAPAST